MTDLAPLRPRAVHPLPRTGPKGAVKAIAAAGILSLGAAGVYAEHRAYEAGRRTLTTAAQATAVPFHPAPINRDWIIAGSPVTEASEVARTHDGTMRVYLWRTTAAKFKWIHQADEIVTILEGSVSVTDADGRTHRLTVGDVALFPAGAVQVWDVPVHLTKSAILRSPIPTPFETAMRWLRRARGLIAERPNPAL